MEIMEQNPIDHRRILNLSLDLICIAGMDGYFKYVNPAWERVLGYTQDELLSSPFLDFIHPEDHAKNDEEVAKLAAGHQTIDFVNRYIHKDGSIRYISWTAQPDADEKEMYCIGRDITERKQVENALRDSQHMLQTVLDSIPSAVFWKDRDSFYLGGNRTWLAAAGLNSSEEVVGKSDYDLPWEKEQADLFREDDRRVMESGIPEYNIIESYRKADVTRAWAKTNKVPLRDTEGNIVGILGTYEDITEQKRSEEALRKSEAFKNTIIESSPDCIKLLDLEGNLKYMNKGGQEKLEIKDIKAYLNKSWIDLWQGEDNINARMAVDTAIKGAMGKFRGYSPTETGIPRWWDVIITPLWGSNEKVEQLLAVSRDITEQKQMEVQLRQSRKLESIGNLAGGIAHDFNNILSPIIGYTELSLDDVERGSQLEDNLQEVYRAGKRARDLVKQILAFARQSDEELRPIQMDTIAKEALKFIRSTIPTSIEIRKKLESRSPIMGNPTQVHQLFMNLCTNAAQAMEDRGGIMEVGLANVELDDRSSLVQLGLKPGDYIKITVSDTGSGIDPNTIDSIFEPYFTTKGIGEGTGMGLALVHGIVESHGGKITVDSELGKGTTFWVYLPITKNREAYRHYEKENLPSGTERILFVDDELPIAKMGSQILERLGYQVTVRTSSVEALELFRSKPNDFDLVITDMTMPNMTGDELAMELIAFRSDIPVILCTGYSKKITDEKAAKIGIKAFAYKPIVTEDLAKTVRKVLNEAKGSAQ